MSQKVRNANITTGGNDQVNRARGKDSDGKRGNDFTLGGGMNTVVMNRVDGSGKEGLSISVAEGTEAYTEVAINGPASYLNYTGSAGIDSITVAGAVSNSNIELGGGYNTFSAYNESKEALQKVSNTNISAHGESDTNLAHGNDCPLYTSDAADEEDR